LKIQLLLIALSLSVTLGSAAQDHAGKPFDYEATLQQLRQAAAKGSAENPDSDRLDALYQIGYIYEIRFKSVKEKKITAYLDSSLRYVQLLIDQSRKAGRQDYEAAAYVTWAQGEMAMEADYRSIVQKYLSCVSLCDIWHRAHSVPGDFLLEIESNAYSAIGYIYFLNREYDNALTYCDRAILHAYPAYVGGLPLVYKARIYMARKNYPAAELALRQALALVEKQHINMRWEAMDYLAKLLIEKGQPDSAIVLMRQAMAGDKKAYHLDMHYYCIGKAFLTKGATDSALSYGRLELALGEHLANSQNRLWAYELLYKAYASSKDKATELKYYQQYVTLSDSLAAIDRGKDISEIQHKYDYRRVQSEAEHQKFLQDQRLQQRTRIFLYIFLGLLSLTAALLGFYLVKMRRKNVELKKKNKEILDAHFKGQHFERKRIASELHDNLSSLLAATKLSIQVLDPSALSAGEQKIFQSVLDMMDTACNEVRYISHNMMPANIERQGLPISLESLVAKLNQTGIILFELTNIDPRLALDKMTAFNIYSICLELCNNILRHSKATRAAIIFKAYEKELHLLITDNGKGIADTKKYGMGIRNVNERIQSLHGTLEVQTSSEGTSFWFTIPLEQQQPVGNTTARR
jgi:signal transduction histidine kinase